VGPLYQISTYEWRHYDITVTCFLIMAWQLIVHGR
jgi:hypothetical protein